MTHEHQERQESSDQLENIVYHNGEAVGMDCGKYIAWFSGATPEIIAELSCPTNFKSAEKDMPA